MNDEKLSIRAAAYIESPEAWAALGGSTYRLVKDLAAEVRELRKDRERLDWIALNGRVERSRSTKGLDVNGPRLRASIDAAMAEASKGGRDGE